MAVRRIVLVENCYYFVVLSVKLTCYKHFPCSPSYENKVRQLWMFIWQNCSIRQGKYLCGCWFIGNCTFPCEAKHSLRLF